MTTLCQMEITSSPVAILISLTYMLKINLSNNPVQELGP